jgi:orotate phosphoribosyltransferase
MMTDEQALGILERRGVLMDGHFVLASKRHSHRFLNLKRGLFPYVTDLILFSQDLADLASPFAPEVFVGPAIGGVALAHHVASQYNLTHSLNVPSCYANKLFGTKNFSLQRGFDELVKGRRVLVVDDDLKVHRPAGLTKAARACDGNVVGLTGFYQSNEISPIECDAPILVAHACNYINWAIPSSVSLHGELLARAFKDERIEVVLGPAVNGVLLAQETAWHLQRSTGTEVISVFAEPESVGELLHIPTEFVPLIAGKRVCVVEDVITTGKSLKLAADAVRQCGGNVVCGLAICIRGKTTADDLGLDILKARLEFRDIESWEPSTCELCAQGIPINTDAGRGSEYLARLAEQQLQ